MNRRTFDALVTIAGLALAVLLAVAGGLALWGHTFADNSVRDQLVAQKIYFPANGSPELASKQIGPYLDRYAGRQMTDGAQAKAYADHFIAVHMQKIGGGQTYSQLSAKAQADPGNTALAGQVDTMFKGDSLRSMLLDAYAFWQIGQIALYAAIACFAGAGVMLALAGGGAWHLRRTTPDTEVLPKVAHPAT